MKIKFDTSKITEFSVVVFIYLEILPIENAHGCSISLNIKFLFH